MEYALIIGIQESDSTWPVFLQNDPIRTEGDIAHEAPPPIGYVASWQELDVIANEYGILSHQIDGDGLAEMERELGPMPSSRS